MTPDTTRKLLGESPFVCCYRSSARAALLRRGVSLVS